MSSKLILLLLTAAVPGYHFQFPHDHFNHPDFETEWWYYTGNLQSNDGHHYGYELTFFRQANTQTPPSNSIWNPNQLYLAHLALSDIGGQKFEHFERLNRSGPGLAGVDIDTRRYWNGNWQVKDNHLRAVGSDFTLNLDLEALKPPVIHGIDGVSQKGPEQGEASHYISFTRLHCQGTLLRDGKVILVNGLTWMDHEFFTESVDANLRGWDWFAIQLDNNEELMLYRLSLKSGEVSPYSSGTFVDATGKAHHLTNKDFSLSPKLTWTSSTSKATYPLEWNIAIPSLGINLNETTRLKQQELSTPNSISPGYWEGAVNYDGTAHGQPIHGVGYLEMTGYLAPLHLGH